MLDNDSSGTFSAFTETPLTPGTDVFGGLTAALDVARNQFRARQFRDASANLTKLINKAEGHLLTATPKLTAEEIKRVNVALASALTLEGRCEEERGEEQRARVLWDRAVGIFDDNLPTPGAP